MPTDERTLHEIIREHMDMKGLPVDRACQITGIPERYLKAILEGNFKSLPAAPYVHAYLKRLSLILEISSDDLIRAYDTEAAPPRSGMSDKLPTNRYAIIPPVKFLTKKSLFIAIIALALIIYLGWGASHIFGIPNLTVTYPTTDVIVTEPTITITGTVSQGDMLTIYNNEVTIGKDGSFSYTYGPLSPGPNIIEIHARRFLGKTVVVQRTIQYQPVQAPKP